MAAIFGYTIFYVHDVGATLNFYVEAFAMSKRFLTPEADYGELNTGATTLAFASTILASGNLAEAGGFTPLDPSRPPVGTSITLLTNDVAATVDSAETAGALRYVEPINKPWGQTVAYVIDPNGILIELATPMEQE